MLENFEKQVRELEGTAVKFGITAAELMEKELPEPRWAIPGILPEGCTFLGGKPKEGKSIAALNIAIAIASGGLALGKIKVPPGGVVYLALEDQERRLQKRLRHMLKYSTGAPANLHLITEWPRMDADGLELLEEKLSGIPDLRLVIIDTLQKFRAPARGNNNVYSEDYDTVSRIKGVADRLGICILIIHHLRKMESDDVFDTLSGSLGLTGAADGIIVMRKIKGNTVLHITGRDVEPAELAIRLDTKILTWTLLGDFSEIKSTAEQQKVYDTLNQEPRSPKEIAEITGLKVGSVKSILSRFIESGDARKVSHGQYVREP